MGTELALTDAERELVTRTVRGIIPDAEFRVFGSRATGRARPYSDLDLLVIKPERLSWQQRVALRDAFEASVLPFGVDVVEVAALPQGMAERVQREMQPI